MTVIMETSSAQESRSITKPRHEFGIIHPLIVSYLDFRWGGVVAITPEGAKSSLDIALENAKGDQKSGTAIDIAQWRRNIAAYQKKIYPFRVVIVDRIEQCQRVRELLSRGWRTKKPMLEDVRIGVETLEGTGQVFVDPNGYVRRDGLDYHLSHHDFLQLKNLLRELFPISTLT